MGFDAVPSVVSATAAAAGAGGPSCHLSRSSLQSIPQSTTQPLFWDTEVFDPDGFHWWKVYGTLRWGVGLAKQAAQHIDGSVPSMDAEVEDGRLRNPPPDPRPKRCSTMPCLTNEKKI